MRRGLVGVGVLLLIVTVSSCTSSATRRPGMAANEVAPRASLAAATATVLTRTARPAPFKMGSGPKYKSCSPREQENCHRDLKHSGRPSCTSWCSSGPPRFTPTRVDVCEGEEAALNARVDGDALSIHGDFVQYSGLSIDWDDGSTSSLPVLTPNGQHWITNQNVTHTWAQATTYRPSLLYFIQHKYDGSGSCSYECRLATDTYVYVHMRDSAECETGVYRAR